MTFEAQLRSVQDNGSYKGVKTYCLQVRIRTMVILWYDATAGPVIESLIGANPGITLQFYL